MKEIHFYAGGEITDDFDVTKMTSLTHSGFRREINKLHDIIRTTSLIDLSFVLIDQGYKIFLHENGKILEMYPGMVAPNGKEIRRHHDIKKLWIAGVWDDYFYSELKDFSKFKIENIDLL